MIQNKIKVLMVGELPIELDQLKGGVVAVIKNLFYGFSSLKDIEIVHVSFNEEIATPIVKQFASNIKIYFLPYKIKIKLIDYFLNKKALKSISEKEKPDLIHIQEVTPHLLRFVFYPKARIVVTQHGIMREEIKTAIGWRNKLKSIFKGSVEKYVFPLFTNIIFISQYNKGLFPSRPIFCEKIFNPVNPIFFESQSDKGLINTLIFVGVINKNKNLKLVLQALGRLKKQQINFTLHVVGGYKQPEYEKEIMAVVSENEVSNQVIFHGWKTQEQLPKLYDQCRIFILPSQQENMPVSIEEAMAQGKVVVASNVGAISEMFTNKKSGFLFTSNDLDQLCEVLKLLYNNEALLDSVSANAFREAKEKFYPELICTKTLSFYHDVLNRS